MPRKISLVPSAIWGGLLHQTLDSLDFYNPTAKKVIANVPNVTMIPFFTTIPIVELTRDRQPQVGPGGPKFLIGPSGNLVPGDLVTLLAADSLALGVGYAIGDTSYMSGFAIPGNGRPLPNSMVLSAAEAASISAAVAAYNGAIATEAAARGYGLLDLNQLYFNLHQYGFTFAGTTFPGSIQGTSVDVCIGTTFPFEDGPNCWYSKSVWSTAQRIYGDQMERLWGRIREAVDALPWVAGAVGADGR